MAVGGGLTTKHLWVGTTTLFDGRRNTVTQMIWLRVVMTMVIIMMMMMVMVMMAMTMMIMIIVILYLSDNDEHGDGDDKTRNYRETGSQKDSSVCHQYNLRTFGHEKQKMELMEHF